jgi:excisionase family DNA binding protein
MEKLLTVREVTDLLRISYSTLYRWLRAGKFPVPVNGRGNKLLWHQSQIQDWSNYRKSASATSNAVTSPASQRRQAKSFQERQAAAEKSLQRHRRGADRTKQ